MTSAAKLKEEIVTPLEGASSREDTTDDNGNAVDGAFTRIAKGLIKFLEENANSASGVVSGSITTSSGAVSATDNLTADVLYGTSTDLASNLLNATRQSKNGIADLANALKMWLEQNTLAVVSKGKILDPVTGTSTSTIISSLAVDFLSKPNGFPDAWKFVSEGIFKGLQKLEMSIPVGSVVGTATSPAGGFISTGVTVLKLDL